jgi:hypothetical protein
MRDLAVAGEAGVRPYVYVESLEDTLEKLSAHGAELIDESYPQGDLWVATFRDPGGNVIGVWQRGPTSLMGTVTVGASCRRRGDLREAAAANRRMTERPVGVRSGGRALGWLAACAWPARAARVVDPVDDSELCAPLVGGSGWSDVGSADSARSGR